ncbi:MAG: hypothetical protein QOF51_2450 [Chloroflexota bacterium]|jgi:hypothetical protein|nr:hypothetical protein [Chloroflexota bacterium]
MARIYAGITGPILLILGVLGLAGFQIPATVSLWQPGEIVIHFLSGIIAMGVYIMTTRGSDVPRLYGRVFGPIYLLIGVVGYAFPDILSGSIFHLDPGCNIVHIIFGIWGVFVGYFATEGARYEHGAQVAMSGA